MDTISAIENRRAVRYFDPEHEITEMDGFDFDAAGRLIHLPADHVIAMFVAVGKKTQEPYARPGQLPREEVVINNRFP